MKKYDCIIKKEETIFRYDLSEPPSEWDVNYKSIEYSSKRFCNPKNMANNFFFFSNEEVTRDTANVAVKLQSKEVYDYWLTQVVALRDIYLLCLCGNDTLYNLLKLYELEIDVFNDNFLFYNNGQYNSFSILKDPLKEWINLDMSVIERKLELRNTLIKPFEDGVHPFGLLGQTLTDFENGLTFAKLLAERGYDGYVFDESVGGHTICLLDSVVMERPSALSRPQKQRIIL